MYSLFFVSIIRKSLLEEYLIAGTADLQELIRNNGVIIKQTDNWMDIFGWEVSIGDKITIQAGSGERLEATVMGIVDEDIPYGGYELVFIPLETLTALMPDENLNYQVLLDTTDDDWEQVRDAVKQIFPTNVRVYVTTLNAWVNNY